MICCPDKSAALPESSTYSAIVEQGLQRKLKMSGPSGTTPVRVTPTFPEQKLTVSERYNSSEISSPEALGYTLGKTLGCGTYAKVKAAWSPHDKKMIAIKILNKRAASKEYLHKFLPREIRIVQLIKHTHIIRVINLVESDRQAFFMLELAENGDLLDYINARQYLPEPEARHIFTQMAGAIAYCHSLGIVHRDLKCENIMLSRDMDVKIGDFGFALCLEENPARTPCGSYSYAAPELFNSNGEPYDGKKADVWSLGVILYAMVCGRLPFGDDSQVKRLQGRHLSFSRPLSLECKKFILAILNTNIDQRLDSSQITTSEWPLMMPLERPKHLIKSHVAKYTIDNCLPPEIQFPRLQPPEHTSTQAPTATHSQAPVHTTVVSQNCSPETSLQVQPDATVAAKSPRPLVAKIGACGRRIADAVKHHRPCRVRQGGIPERATT